ncbi:MAG: hypothetical protein JNM55_10525 [Anaerolineales bacterium]|nr:hypothetical protein [Anaerolineales bacterium]
MDNQLGIKDYYFVRDVVESTSNVRIGMEQLLDYCKMKSPDPVWATIRNFEFEGEIPKLELWLLNVLSSEPPSNDIKAFWFGLFNPILDNETSCGFYICGSTNFASYDRTSDWACWQKDTYLPTQRYADSRILREIYSLVDNNNNVSNFAEFILALGYTCLAVKYICRSINPNLILGDRKRRDIAVGFDSGDSIILEGVER